MGMKAFLIMALSTFSCGYCSLLYLLRSACSCLFYGIVQFPNCQFVVIFYCYIHMTFITTTVFLLLHLLLNSPLIPKDFSYLSGLCTANIFPSLWFAFIFKKLFLYLWLCWVLAAASGLLQLCWVGVTVQ